MSHKAVSKLSAIASINASKHLKYLYLDGNRVKDEGCKVIAHALRSNNALKIVSIEENKCTFKGFDALMDAIADNLDTALCDIPIHSILEDPIL
jgi:Ran GTPase-activating protein (RanGAP) involved in mRNA processing and transport